MGEDIVERSRGFMSKKGCHAILGKRVAGRKQVKNVHIKYMCSCEGGAHIPSSDEKGDTPLQ